ncbi:hypothetical protein Tco_1077257, partial [Tanacetum coccineum]
MSKLPKIKNSRRSRSRSPSPGGSVNASGTGKDSPVSINDKDKVEKRSFTKEMKEHCWKMAKRRSGLSDLDNMQILQTQVNRKKFDNVLDKYVLKGFSCRHNFT